MTRWFKINDIGRMQIELTNYCNANCPMCDRYEIDFQAKDGRNITLNDKFIPLSTIEKAFGSYQWDSLDSVHFCGCIDEPTIHPEMIDVTKFFLSLNDRLKVTIATNGGTRNENFWAELGHLSKSNNNRIVTAFSIDGLDTNNHLYRRNVSWSKLEKNFRAYIKNGGYAIWKCIIFPYNIHILDQIRDVSIMEGFENFILIKTGRSIVDSTDDGNELLMFFDDRNVIPEWYQNEDPSNIRGTDMIEIQNKKIENKCVRCAAMPDSMDNRFHPTKANIYVDYKGQVIPCCWVGNPFDLITMQQRALRERGITPLTHNISHHGLQDIIDGPFWQFIYDEFEKTEICVNKCRKLTGDIWL